MKRKNEEVRDAYVDADKTSKFDELYAQATHSHFRPLDGMEPYPPWACTKCGCLISIELLETHIANCPAKLKSAPVYGLKYEGWN